MSQRSLLAAGIGAALGVAMLVVQILLLAEIRVSREEIEAQREIAARVEEQGTPLFRDARPVLEAARGALGGLRDPGSGSGDSLDDVRSLAGAARQLTKRGAALLGAISVADVASTLTGVNEVTRTALASGVGELIARANGLLREIEDADLLNTPREGLDLLEGVVALQREILHVQRDARRFLIRSLDVQRRSLKHIRSIDRKTGGPVPRSR